jgi:hypothetical protein
MNNTPSTEANIWDAVPQETPKKKEKPAAKPVLPVRPQASESHTPDRDFDLEGLMTDFPTATDLERFVFDQTGVVLSLKGRANKLKYQVAMDVLNGTAVDPKFIGSDNPYLDKTDLVPEEPMKTPDPRDHQMG